MTKIAINGFGRIGRPALKVALTKKEMEVAAINDLADLKTAAYLFKHDSSYGTYEKEVSIDENQSELIVDGKRIKYFSEKEISQLPWKDLGVDVILECTGVFKDTASCQEHLKAGAKKVILSAPPARNASLASASWRSDVGGAKDDMPVYLIGVNEKDYQGEAIISNGSCTTNCLAPVIKVLDDNFGVEKGFMTTVHSYTNDQRLLDLFHKDLRHARAAGMNIIPTTTGAAKTVGKALKHLQGKLDGIALRVPTPVVSIADFICNLKKEVSAEEINQTFRQSAEGDLRGILGVNEEELVSMDFKGDARSAIVDLTLTMAKGNLAKVASWYDNEWGYANRLVELAKLIASE